MASPRGHFLWSPEVGGGASCSGGRQCMGRGEPGWRAEVQAPRGHRALGPASPGQWVVVQSEDSGAPALGRVKPRVSQKWGRHKKLYLFRLVWGGVEKHRFVVPPTLACIHWPTLVRPDWGPSLQT